MKIVAGVKMSYWSRGDDGKFHNVQTDGCVIEASYNIAAERQITIDDVTALSQKTRQVRLGMFLEKF